MNINIRNKYLSIPVQARASMWFLICAFLQKGISFITTPIFTRIMTTTEYGQYGEFNSWLSMVSVIVTLNLFSGVYVRGLVAFEKDRHIFTSSLQSLVLCLVFSWTTLYLLFHRIINSITNLTTPQMLLMFLIIWTTSIFNFWSMSQRVDFKYRTLVLVTLIVSIANPIVGILLIHCMEDKVTARILGIAIVELIMYSGLFVSHITRGRVLYSAKYWKHAIGFNLPLIPHYLSTTILNSSDRIMIGRMVNSSTSGIYTLAYSISMIMTMFNSALLQTLEPWLYKKIKAQKIKDIAQIAYPSFIVIAAVNLVLIAVAPEIVRLFAPEAYYDAIWVIPPIASSVYFMFSYTFFAVFEFYYEKTKLVAIATCTGAILNIVLNYIFIGLFGYYAAGYTTLVCFICYSLFHFYMMQKICKEKLNGVVPYDFKVFIGIAILFLCCSAIFMFTYRYPIIRYCLIGLILVVLCLLHKRIIQFAKHIISIKKTRT